MPPLKTKQQLAKEQKASNARERQIAKQYLQSGPSISNLYNAFMHWYNSVPFLGGQPETGNQYITGTPPAVGIKNLEKVTKVAKVAGEINKAVSKGVKAVQKQKRQPIVRTKVGDVEIDNPQLAYRQGPTVVEDFNKTGVVTPPEKEAEIVQTISEDAPLLDKINIRLKPKTFNNPMFAQGRLWYKSPVESFGSMNSIGNAKQQQLIVTAEPLRVASKTSAPMKEWSNIGGTFDVRDTGPLLNFDRRIPITESQLGPHNVSSYIWDPGYGYRRFTNQTDIMWRQANDVYQQAYKFPIGYDSRGQLFTNKNYFFRRGYDLIDDAQRSGVIRVPSGDYKPAVLEKYPFLNDGNQFSTMKISHKFPYFSEGELWPLKYSNTAQPDLIAIPNNIKGVKWVAGNKWGTLKENAKPSDFGGRGTPLINGQTNQFPSEKAMFYRFNEASGRYEPVNRELIQTEGSFDLPFWNSAPAKAIAKTPYIKPDGMTLKKIFNL